MRMTAKVEWTISSASTFKINHDLRLWDRVFFICGAMKGEMFCGVSKRLYLCSVK